MNATSNAGCSQDELTRFQKFVCYRVDGKDRPGHRYFVGDYANDPHAWMMACSYATTAGPDYPQVAQALARELVDVYPALVADPKHAQVFRRVFKTLGLPPDVEFTDTPLYRLMRRYANPQECPRDGSQADGQAPPQAGGQGQ